MPTKNYTLFFLLSVGFVLISIAFITILGQTNNRDSGAADIRAKATVQNSMQLEGDVASVDTKAWTMVVNNVTFADNQTAKPMGTFTVIIPNNTNVKSGQRVVLAVDSQSFNVTSKTFAALAVQVR